MSKLMECMENRVKQSRKKIKGQMGTGSPNHRKQRTSGTKDDLMRRLGMLVVLRLSYS